MRRAFCIATCEDLYNPGGTGKPVPANIVSFCTATARPATNFAPQGGACEANACLDVGQLRAAFVDPRRTPETVTWRDLFGAAANGGTLTRTARFTNAFDTGGDSSEVITQGDAYVEFTAIELDTARLCGLSNGAPPDADPSDTGIGFAIDLFADGHFYVFENGAKRHGADIDESFGTYTSGERFRVNVFDNFDGTARITYSRLTGSCLDGRVCPEDVFYQSTSVARYPLRVDASLREIGATITNARLVRIR